MRTAALFAVASTLFAESAYYLVLQKGVSSLAWYTPDGKIENTVAVGQHPHEMVFSRDKRYLYTTDNGTMRIEQPGAGGNKVSIIDLVARKRIGQISTGEYRRPHGIDIDPATGRLAVTSEAPDKLLIVDPSTRTVLRAYDTRGKTPHMVTFGPGAKFAYVSNSGSGTIAAIRLSDGEVKTIPTGTRPEASALSPNGKELYVCNRESGTVSVIDTSKNAVVATIQTGKGPVRAAVTPDGRTLVYALMHDKQIGMIDTATRRQVTTVPVSGTPISLTLSSDGRTACASAEEEDTVFVISVPARRVVKTLKTPKGAGPDPVLEYPSH